MYKYRYVVGYTVRPNKKTEGAVHSMSVTLSGKIEEREELAKLMLMLTKIHRVNHDAIILGRYILIERVFMPGLWFKNAMLSLFKRLSFARN